MPRIRECVSHGCLRQHRHVAAGLTAYGSVNICSALLGGAPRSPFDRGFIFLGPRYTA